jgi:hypothetical protein
LRANCALGYQWRCQMYGSCVRCTTRAGAQHRSSRLGIHIIPAQDQAKRCLQSPQAPSNNSTTVKRRQETHTAQQNEGVWPQATAGMAAHARVARVSSADGAHTRASAPPCLRPPALASCHNVKAALVRKHCAGQQQQQQRAGMHGLQCRTNPQRQAGNSTCTRTTHNTGCNARWRRCRCCCCCCCPATYLSLLLDAFVGCPERTLLSATRAATPHSNTPYRADAHRGAGRQRPTFATRLQAGSGPAA